MIRFIYLCSFIFLAQERGNLCFKRDDLDATDCNYGKHEMDNLNWCDCKNVLGNGPHCEIKKLFNSTHIQVIFAIVPDHLDSWLKNLETQFPKKMITIVEETKYYVKGFVNNRIYFNLHLLPSIIDKKDILVPRSNSEMIEEILFKEVEMRTVPTKESIRKSAETSRTNETKMVKNDSIYFYSTWALAVILFPFILVSIIRCWKNIKKNICLPTVNRLKLNIENGEHSEGEEYELSDLLRNPNDMVTERSTISLETNDEQRLFEEVSENSNVVNRKIKIGRKAIHFQCKNDNFEKVKMLIAKGFDIERKDEKGMRPIHFACENGNIDIVNLLIAKGCDINMEDEMGWRPIHFACENGNIDIVNLLIVKGCDINMEDKMGMSLIHFACKNDNFEIVNLLIAKGCDIERKDEKGRRPIHFACKNGNIDIVNLLIAEGCDISIEDEMGWRPIHFACKNGHIDIVNLLIAKGSDINIEDEMGWRLIHFACKNGHIDIVNLLIDKGCHIDSEDKMGTRPIHLTCQNGSIDIMNLLIDKGCNIDKGDEMGSRPIHFACENGNIEIVEVLITKGCNFDSEDKLGNRPIHFADERGHTDIVNLLITKGCNIYSEDKKGRRLIDRAFEKCIIEMGKVVLNDIEMEKTKG